MGEGKILADGSIEGSLVQELLADQQICNKFVFGPWFEMGDVDVDR